MNTKLLVLFLGTFFLFSGKALADSPVTSTYFADEYYDEPIVLEAGKSNGIITPSMMDYMINPKNPIDVKLAIINELSWDINGKNNSEIFIDYLIAKKGYKNEKRIMKKANADILICLAYLQVMDDYFRPEIAFETAKAAQKKNKKSYSINLIKSLIEAQILFDSDWCDVYRVTNLVRINKKLKMDMRPAAVIKAHEYCDLYKDYC